MLRKWVLGVGLAVLGICTIVLITTGFPPMFVFLFWGVVLVLGIVFERFRYKPIEQSKPGPGWERTTERFVDEDSGKTVTVYIQPATGERAYVRE